MGDERALVAHRRIRQPDGGESAMPEEKSYYRQLRIDPLPPESAEELLDALLGADRGSSAALAAEPPRRSARRRPTPGHAALADLAARHDGRLVNS